MKKIFFILMLIPGIGLSQSTGINIGVNSTNITGSKDGKDYSRRTGTSCNIFYAKEFKKINITGGIGYSEIRSAYEKINMTTDGTFAISNAELVSTYKYLDVPLSVNYTPLNNKVIAGIGLGLTNKFLVSSSERNTNSYVAEVTPSGFIGYKFENISILGGVKYGQSLNNINNSGNSYNYLGGFITIKYSWQ